MYEYCRSYIYINVHVYIYIYKDREREREKASEHKHIIYNCYIQRRSKARVNHIHICMKKNTKETIGGGIQYV